MPKRRPKTNSQQQLDFALEPDDLSRRQRFRARCQLIESAPLSHLTAGQTKTVRRLLKHLTRKGGIVTLRYPWLAADLDISVRTAKNWVHWARLAGVIETAVSCDQYGRRRTTIEIMWPALQPLGPIPTTNEAQPRDVTPTNIEEQPSYLNPTNHRAQPQPETPTILEEQPDFPPPAITAEQRQQSAPKCNRCTNQSATVADQSATVADQSATVALTRSLDPHLPGSLPGVRTECDAIRPVRKGIQKKISFDQLAHLVTQLRAAMRYRGDAGHNVARIAAAVHFGLLPENDVRDSARGVGVLRPANPPAYFFQSVANACTHADRAALRRLLGRIDIVGLTGGDPAPAVHQRRLTAIYDQLERIGRDGRDRCGACPTTSEVQ